MARTMCYDTRYKRSTAFPFHSRSCVRDNWYGCLGSTMRDSCNPHQKDLQEHDGMRTVHVLNSWSALSRLSNEGPQDAPLNVILVWNPERDGRVTDVTMGDIILDSGPYNYGFAFARGTLKSGRYAIIVSGFDPQVRTDFTLSVECSKRFDMRPKPTEGAGMFSKSIKGNWVGSSAAGPPSQGSYHKNPGFKLVLPESSTIIIRLQRSNHNSRTPINIAIFASNPSVFPSNIPAPVLSSGGYSAATSGVVITSSHLTRGTYYLLPSTARAGLQEGFVTFVYCLETQISLEAV
ncbi:uncharacterized protein EI90DRAFT_3053715 [Cantharellus anzutake]|uniref:uncharacterized protein n=1 Tax=Cantharellus anzutake TaxID=1750568 RepID=UPI0019085507|nr:uncharacterized protein EI90DRAFT_3053715 [Cantharellus anzutake]KAF8332602.1 hypothetical protein EI90DRAFT_3053715 [Cantharellus anzutake]